MRRIGGGIEHRYISSGKRIQGRGIFLKEQGRKKVLNAKGVVFWV